MPRYAKKSSDKPKTKSESNSEESELSQEESENPAPIEIVFDWASALSFALVFVLLLLTFVFRQVTVNGSSMNNTLNNGDRLGVTNFMYTPQYGDIIVVSHGNDYEDAIIKRVIATPGQSLLIDYNTGEVQVDGVILDEKYIKGDTVKLSNSTDIPDKIPEGYVFVMGDNRENSLDSRSNDIGLIPYSNIVGKAVFRIYPFNSFGGVYNNI